MVVLLLLVVVVLLLVLIVVVVLLFGAAHPINSITVKSAVLVCVVIFTAARYHCCRHRSLEPPAHGLDVRNQCPHCAVP